LAVSDPGDCCATRNRSTRAEVIGQQLRCLVCQNESVEESDADLAHDLRYIIRQRLVSGDSMRKWSTGWSRALRQLRPVAPAAHAMTIVLWGAPGIALLVGAGAVLIAVRRRRTPPAPAE